VSDRDSTSEVGRRLEMLRRRAGLSRERLAALADVSPVLVKFVENGRRSLTLRTALRLAPVLGIRDLAELYGSNLRLSLGRGPSHPRVPAVRLALTGWQLHVAGAPHSPDYLRDAVDAAWRSWHSSRRQRTDLGAVLPSLIASARRSVRLLEPAPRRVALPLLAQCYHLAQVFLAHHGDRELLWLAVDRGMAAAIESGDPLATACGAYYAAHLLRGVGDTEAALQLLGQARAEIEPLARRETRQRPEYAAMIADLCLCTAVTKARNGDRAGWQDWAAARSVVDRLLPPEYVHPWTRVGPVLVEVTAVALAVDLGDVDEAQRRAEGIDPQAIPSVERRARHLVDLARAADLDGAREETLHLLSRAAEVSPETVTYLPVTRELLARLMAVGPATIRPDVLRLAAMARMPGYAPHGQVSG
jgi:transcriptional regulator with XRE-family HTH domain